MKNLTARFLPRTSLTVQELHYSTLQLEMMLRAGVPLTSALNALSEHSEDHVGRIWYKVLWSLEAGHSFSESLAKEPESFSPSYRSFISTGEATGSLLICLSNVASLEKKKADMRSKIQGAIIYPLVLLVSSLLMIGLMLTLVLPMILEVVDQSQSELPAITKFMMKAGAPETLATVIAVLFLVGLAIRVALTRPRSEAFLRDFWERWTPIGRFLVRSELINSLTQLSLMLHSGCDFLKSLRLSARMGRRSFRLQRAFDIIERRIKEGEGLADSFSQHDVFPSFVGAFLAVGEQTGNVSDLLNIVSKMLSEELDAQLEAFGAVLEPLVLGFTGVFIGATLLAAFLPIYNMVSF